MRPQPPESVLEPARSRSNELTSPCPVINHQRTTLGVDDLGVAEPFPEVARPPGRRDRLTVELVVGRRLPSISMVSGEGGLLQYLPMFSTVASLLALRGLDQGGY